MSNNEILNNFITISENLNNEKTHLTVVMPVYNEGKHIKDNLIKTAEIISSFSTDFSIMAVNDGSNDNSLSEIKKASHQNSSISFISYEKNKGKGHAIATGVRYSNSDYIAFLDSDLELSPTMLKDFLYSIKKEDADIVIGSKLHKDSRLVYPMSRKILSFGYFIILKIMFNLNIKDTQTGIKLFKSDILKPICENLCTNGFAFDIEILATASKKGCKIIEMPIELNYSRNKDEKSKVSIKTINKVFKDTLHIKKKLKSTN